MYTVLQSCTITSPSANTIRVSCELLETFTRISVTISSNSCTCSQPITMIDDNPITVSDLPIGVYTVEVTAVNSNDMNKSTATDESGMYVHTYVSMYACVHITCTVFIIKNKMLIDLKFSTDRI